MIRLLGSVLVLAVLAYLYFAFNHQPAPQQAQPAQQEDADLKSLKIN